jgi:zinc protease
MSAMDRTTAPEAHIIRQVPLPVPTTVRTDRGLPIHVVDAGTQDVVRIELVTRGGVASADRNLVATYSAKMLTEGTAGMNAAQIAERVEHYGATLHAEADQDQCVLTLTCLGRHLTHLLPVLTEVFVSPIFPQREFDIIRQNGLQELRVNMQKVAYLARTSFSRALYGAGHPYGRTATEADFGSLECSVLKTHHHNHVLGGLSSVMVAGKVDDARLRCILDALNGLPVSGNRADAGTANDYQTTKSEHVDHEGAVQNAIRMGRVLFTRNHPDFIDMSILCTVLGGHFGSRLMNNLREDKGFTYGVNATLQSFVDAGHLVIGTEVGADVCDAALNEIWKEIERLRREPVPSDELDLVRNYLIGRALSGVDGPFALADKWRMYHRHGLGADQHQRYIDRIWEVSSERLLMLAEQYLDPAQITVVTAGRPPFSGN